ncbi:acyl-CoA dehydrogenase family protein [Tenacibaculum finnmarkense genomovar finnmarkense]|uniref:acyl-CoA dehydrogenase family protein n=1 Tax=Tenacibaculum finnmarkense TaxID=2781243 RepID=UPI00187B79B7|nr:acyl-CoA dehydrogenase family protein [Tenacibaculum finnmarkense]MBE7659306.1 acyl-CoA dehydrogenase [Tenacibaculum finnmarkense genomovar finnmarkense]MCD8413518.1 acyl-CoA dehydrogenase family protein [Tenacibaculum finnmarkense genomovar ulcerans]MCD8418020.1 acyl-CoA dehydrogenase family protein [Tenacibaculum finnmarkense genomovar finnmarkense]MCG8186407.1 acyl-CoA dehydrogenase family protein [Tenacibaculum finnmarkense genomovar finnmarkense]MCG8202862.1 acyl-CoA dehydrogenase fami
MNNMYFTEEHESFRESFKSFLQKEVVPHINKWEKDGAVERFIWKKFGEMGYFGLNQPEEHGGLGLDLFYTVIFLEELQKVNSGGFAAAMWAHAYLAMTHLNKEGDARIKKDYLTPSINGDKIGCLCISEPFGGSDVAGMRTTAVKKDDTYVINGSKTFITNGIYSDYLVVAAKTNPQEKHKGMSIFIVDRDTPGISATKLDKLGWRASDTAEIAFDNVVIPAKNLMGEEGKGFPYIMQHFALERLIMAINAHARAEYAVDYVLKYMSEREAFGKTLDKFQALRHKVAEMASKVDMCREYNYSITKRLNDGVYVVKEASMSKMLSTKMADEVIYDALQLLGGYGYMEEYPLARLLRDSRLGPIGGGTSEILKEIIAKMIIDKKEYKPAT